MTAICPTCSQHIEIDSETLADLQGHEHFQCPSCNGFVAVPPINCPKPVAPVRITAAAAIRPCASSKPPASILTRTHRGINRNMLILGCAALLVLGGIAFFLASRKSEDNHNTTQNIRNEIINNSYFQNLISSGDTTKRDLEAVIDIRPYGDGFIGISKELLTWEQV